MFIKQQLQIDLFFFLASRDVVRNVKIAEFNDNSWPGLVNSKSFQYQISWRPPIQPNGLIYFYMIYIAQNSNNGPKQESCVGNDIRSINVTLSPRTHYRLRIITYTVARLNNEYKDREQIQDESFSSNGTYLFYEEIFITKDLQSRKEKFNLIFSIFFCLRVSGDITRQSRSVFFILIIGSIVLLLIIIVGAPFYYYKYGREITKASISKNPNYGLFVFLISKLIVKIFDCLELYTPDQWEIDKDSVTLDHLIGQGHFGQVYQGVLKLQDGTFKPCAVKVNYILLF